MTFSAAWKAIADDPWGEALDARIDVRADTPAGSDQLIRISDLEKILELSPLVRRRERDPAVVEGQTWGARFTHDLLTFNRRSAAWPSTEDSLLMKWARVQIGFAEADEWATVAQGRIERAEVDTDGVASIDVVDPIMDLLQVELSRDKAWTTTGWFSQVRPEKVALGSSTYDNAQPIALGATPAAIVDQTFRITFTGASTFDLTHVEDAHTQSGLSTGSNNNIVTAGAAHIGTIPSAAWSGGTFVAGDTFLFYASRQYSTAELNPITVIRELLTTGGVESYDVGAGSSQDVEYDSAHWDDVEARFTSIQVRGEFEKGANVMDLIQGLLVGANASLFPSGTGQIGIYHFHPDDVGTSSVVVTGDPEDPDVSILRARRLEDKRELKNRVVIAFKTLTGLEDASFEAPDTTSPYPVDLPLSLASVWAWTPTQIENTANNLLVRKRRPTPQYHITGTLRRLSYHEIGQLLALAEPELSEAGLPVQVTELSIDVLANQVEAIAWNDPAVLSTFFKVGTSAIGGTDVIL